jgi:hypothetical protein
LKTKFVCEFISLTNIIPGQAVQIQPKEQMIFMKTDLGAEVQDNLIFIEK